MKPEESQKRMLSATYQQPRHDRIVSTRVGWRYEHVASISFHDIILQATQK
jgi:hypothetical protein